MTNATFETPLTGVLSAAMAKALNRAFGYESVGQLLWHLPRRYSERGELTPLAGLPVGEHVTVVAQVLDVRARRTRQGGNLVEVRITDGTGQLTLTFFNQPWRQRELRPGVRGTFAGKVTRFQSTLQLQHPDYSLFEESQYERDDLEAGLKAPDEFDEAAARAWAQQPVPIYPATTKLPSWVIAQAVGAALDAVRGSAALDDALPHSIIAAEGILAFSDAIELIHRPKSKRDWRDAQQSLRFREAFMLQLSLLERQRAFKRSPSTPRPAQGSLLHAFDEQLPFAFTADQRDVAETIAHELAQPHPMHRLLQGEVGSGKTVVALRAMLQVAETQGQSALLAPTEVLASQHFRSITETLGDELTAQLQPVLLTGSLGAAERKRALLAIASGASRIVVGTHALISEQVMFADLGLIVVDEQHRFGVDQREALRAKGSTDSQQGGPHVLAMTATPIPRTVALTAFGDLEVSTIRQLPAGRKGIETFVVPEREMPARLARVWQRMAEEVAAGRRVYVVCPAIEPGSVVGEGIEPAEDDERSERAPLASVAETLDQLRNMPVLQGVNISGLTGAMSANDKDQTMADFSSGRVQILVATTVIEVGVNVPEATMMVVRDADRFGISQLHQLRGRVGRGEQAGLCLLLTTAEAGSLARSRVEAVAQTTDGFSLAEIDLELRGEGDILGTMQSGARSSLKLLRVTQHADLIEHARDVAQQLLLDDPHLERAPLLGSQLAQLLADEQIAQLEKS